MAVRHVTALLLLAVCVLASGCGSSSHASPSRAVAIIAGNTINRSDLQRYVKYTVRFYAWAHNTGSPIAADCTSSASTGCARIEKQVLTRLIEQSVVLDFAKRHGIGLTSNERTRIERQIDTLDASGGGGSGLLAQLGVDRAFMRSVLGTQLLVQKVESFVAPTRTKRGYAYHLRKILIPQETSSSGSARDAAATVAIQGAPIPPDASVSNGWVAAGLVSRELKHLVAYARPEEYVGPLRRPNGYLVVQFLGRGVHRFGPGSRQHLMTRYFHAWLKRSVNSERPTCFDSHERGTSCPSGV